MDFLKSDREQPCPMVTTVSPSVVEAFESLWQEPHDVAGSNALHSQLFCRQVSGKTMHVRAYQTGVILL